MVLGDTITPHDRPKQAAKRAGLFLGAVLVTTSLFVSVESSAPSFQRCIREYKRDHNPTSAQQTPSKPKTVVVQTFIVCSGRFSDAHSGGITALASILIAAFTATLWITNGRQLRLARDEFNATHRPKIIVRNFQIGDDDFRAGKPVTPLFIAQNIGDSPGRIIEVRSGVIALDSNAKLPTNLSFPFKEPFDVRLASGERELFPANVGINAGDHGSVMFSEGFSEGSSALHCLGVVVYLDAQNTRRETGFCRRYFPKEERWETVESEYEYAY
jgi:hypothetical protein